MEEQEMTTGSVAIPEPYEPIISYCLQVLNSYPSAAALYILSCLCPGSFPVVMGLVRLDLNQSHQHQSLSEKEPSIPCSYEDLLQDLQIQMKRIPAEDYPPVWLQLAGQWLLTCPVDMRYYRVDDTGRELFCQSLRSELLDRILDIN